MDSIVSNSVQCAIIAAAIVGAMALFKRLFPAKNLDSTLSEHKFSDLDDRFMALRVRVIGGMIAIAIVFFFGSWQALTSLNRFLAIMDSPSSLHLLPQTAIWFFFPGFGAIALCWEITLQVWALFDNRDTVNLFSDWTNQTTKFWGAGSYPGMDSRKVLRWMALLIALPIGVATLLAIDMHATLGPDTIRDCGFAFKPCIVYPLSDVRHMTQIEGFSTKDGELTKRAGIILDFKDGRRWSSADWGNFQAVVDPSLVDFLKQKTGLVLDSVTTEEEIPRLPSQSSPAAK
jgi:hypothetical protein